MQVCVSVCEVAQLCLTLCDPVDCSPPGSSIHGILQARILEWVAISFSRGSAPPRDQTQRLNPPLLHWQVDSLPLSQPGSPVVEGGRVFSARTLTGYYTHLTDIWPKSYKVSGLVLLPSRLHFIQALFDHL